MDKEEDPIKELMKKMGLKPIAGQGQGSEPEAPKSDYKSRDVLYQTEKVRVSHIVRSNDEDGWTIDIVSNCCGSAHYVRFPKDEMAKFKEAIAKVDLTVVGSPKK